MRKKLAITLLSLFSAIGFTLGAGACKNNEQTSEKPQTSVDGFNIIESFETTCGSPVSLEEPLVFDNFGNLLDCWTYVTDPNGNYVETSAGVFVAANPGVYKITYVVRAEDNTTFEKTTTITVTGTAVNDNDPTLTVDFEQFVTVGDQVTIDAFSSDPTKTLSYAVKHTKSGVSMETSDNTFVAEKTGVYEVKVSIVGTSVSYVYNIFADSEMQEGLVESFDETWLEKQAFIGGKRQACEIVTSEECGLTDRFGKDSTLVKYQTESAYIPFFIDIREDVEYYEQLAKEGYTHVSWWIYMDSEKPHETVNDRDANGGFYRKEGPVLYPDQWIQFKLNLVNGQAAYNRSFVTCYNLYDNEKHHFLQVDNSHEWNDWGGEDSITFYFSDIYAIKPVTVSASDNVETNAAVGDSVDFASMFSSEYDLGYSVTYRGKTVALDSSDYTFTGNGEYVVSAYPKGENYEGLAQITFNVSDKFTVESNYVMKERTGASVAVAMSELGSLQFSTVNGITPVTSENISVYYNDELVSIENGSFVATKDGQYRVEVKGEYDLNGVACVSYQDLSVDVYSQATKYDVIDMSKVATLRAWDWDGRTTSSEYGEYTVGGITGTCVKVTASNSQSLTTYAKPLFSKAYYEALYKENADTLVRINIYFESNIEGKDSNFRALYQSSKLTWGHRYNNTWQTYQIPLGDYIELYDDVANNYELYKTASYSEGTNGYKGAWLYLVGSQMTRTVYFDVTLGVDAETASVSMKSGEKLQANKDNKLLDMLNVQVDGEAGQIVRSEVFFNNEWTMLEGSVFKPTWPTSYQFRFYVQSMDGFKSKLVEATFTVGNGSFKATVDTDLHMAKAGTSFDFGELISDEYQYDVEVVRKVGGVETLVATLYNQTTIDTTGFEAASYTVKIYALNGDGEFAKILYYTFTLDVYTDATKYMAFDGNNARTLRAWDWDSSSTTAVYGEYTVDGNTGNYLKATAKGQSLTTYMLPMYSKAYYEALYAENQNFKVSISIYQEAGGSGDTNFRAFYQSSKLEWKDKYNSQWQTYEFTLAQYIELYDEIVSQYETYRTASYSEGTNGYKGAWLYLVGSRFERTVYMSAIIYAEAETATVTLKNGAMPIQLDCDNNLNELLTAKLDGVKGVIDRTEVYFNGVWVTVKGNVFKPVWAVKYQFRFSVKSTDGVKRKVVETEFTVGNGSFTATVDTTLHTAKVGETFNFASFLSTSYQYDVEILRKIGGVDTLVKTLQAQTTIDTTGFDPASYTVKIYALNGDSAFAKILYYTFTLDVYTEATKYAVFDWNNARTLRAWSWDNSNTTAEGGEYTAGGKTGNFLKATAEGQSLTTYVLPMYSKAYYEALSKENANAKVTVEIYLEAGGSGDTNFRAFYQSSKLEWKDKYNSQWQTYEFTLATYIELYDEIVSKYETYKSASYSEDTAGYKGALLYLVGSRFDRTVYVNATIATASQNA